MAQLVKLIDFGSSGRIGDGLEGMVASAHYVAPEVVLSCGYGDQPGTNAPYTEACDLWSLGVLLCVLATPTASTSAAKLTVTPAAMPTPCPCLRHVHE